VNLSLRDILAGGVGHLLSKVKDFRDCIVHKPIFMRKPNENAGKTDESVKGFDLYCHWGIIREWKTILTPLFHGSLKAAFGNLWLPLR
jgi:hypothetical protein